MHPNVHVESKKYLAPHHLPLLILAWSGCHVLRYIYAWHMHISNVLDRMCIKIYMVHAQCARHPILLAHTQNGGHAIISIPIDGS